MSGGRGPDLRALARAMAAQRAALRGAAPEALALQTARIDALCARLEATRGAPSAGETALLGELRAMAAAGLRDLSATLAGLRDAQRLLAETRAAAETRTYGPQGQRLSLAAEPGRLERRR